MTDTFLPARGWNVNDSAGTSGTVKRSVGWPMTNWRNSNTVEYYWTWFTLPTSDTTTDLTLYEDATWTIVPGDNPVDTTNSITWTVASSTDAVFLQDWKFWVSDEENSLFMITQGSRLHWWGGDFRLGRWKPNSNYGPDNGSSDQWQTHYFPFYADQLKQTNLPSTTNTSSSENTLSFQVGSSYANPVEASLVRNFTLSLGVVPVGGVDYNDIRLSDKPYSSRPAAATISSSPGGNTLYKYLVNGTEWWLINGVITSENCMAFYMGTSEPDIS